MIGDILIALLLLMIGLILKDGWRITFLIASGIAVLWIISIWRRK